MTTASARIRDTNRVAREFAASLETPRGFRAVSAPGPTSCSVYLAPDTLAFYDDEDVVEVAEFPYRLAPRS